MGTRQAKQFRRQAKKQIKKIRNNVWDDFKWVVNTEGLWFRIKTAIKIIFKKL